MTYVSPQQTDSQTTSPTSSVRPSELFNPTLLNTAREIYSNYKKVHSQGSRRSVIGVVIHQKTGRGQLVFQGKPVLLPYECFIPLEQIESVELN